MLRKTTIIAVIVGLAASARRRTAIQAPDQGPG